MVFAGLFSRIELARHASFRQPLMTKLVTRLLLVQTLILRLPASTCVELESVTMATMGMSRPFRAHAQYVNYERPLHIAQADGFFALVLVAKIVNTINQRSAFCSLHLVRAGPLTASTHHSIGSFAECRAAVLFLHCTKAVPAAPVRDQPDR